MAFQGNISSMHRYQGREGTHVCSFAFWYLTAHAAQNDSHRDACTTVGLVTAFFVLGLGAADGLTQWARAGQRAETVRANVFDHLANILSPGISNFQKAEYRAEDGNIVSEACIIRR